MSATSENQILRVEAKSTPIDTGRLIDIALLLTIAFLAFLYHIGRIGHSYPLVVLGGDGANIASWAAAWDHPERFATDNILSNSGNFSFYQTVHIPLIRFLASMNGDNYGLAFGSLLGPHIFVYLLGYYVLGRILFKNRYWAILFSIVNMGFLEVNLGEYWGVHFDPQPRLTFQSLLPYVLALAILWRSKPARWPWIMVLMGLLIYVHPVSAPAWAFAAWLGLWLFHAPSWPRRKRVGVMLLLGLVFVTISAPFLLNYLQNRPPPGTQNYQEAYAILQSVHVREVWDIPYAVLGFIKITIKNGLLPLAILGFVLVWWLSRKDRSTFLLILTWLIGIGLTAVVLPFVEQNIERGLQILPLQIDLIRSLRYTVLFMLLFCVWALTLMSQQFKQQQLINMTGAVLAGLWIYTHQPYTNLLSSAVTCLQSGNLICLSSRPYTLELLSAVLEQTPPDARIMPSFGENNSLLMLRYVALRPLVFTQKDRALFGYNIGGQAMRDWNATYDRAIAIQEIQDDGEQLRALVEFSRSRGAEYLVVLNDEIDPMFFPSLSLEVIFSNAGYSLIRL